MSASAHGLPDRIFEAAEILDYDDGSSLNRFKQALDRFTVSTFLERYLAYRLASTPAQSVASLQSQATNAIITHLTSSDNLDEELRTLVDPEYGLNEGGYRRLMLDPRLPYTIMRKLLHMRPCEACGIAPRHSRPNIAVAGSGSESGRVRRRVNASRDYAIAHDRLSKFQLLNVKDFAEIMNPDQITGVRGTQVHECVLPEPFERLDWSNILLFEALHNAEFVVNVLGPECADLYKPQSGPIIYLALYGLTRGQALQKVTHIVSTLSPSKSTAPPERYTNHIVLGVEHHNEFVETRILLRLFSTPAEALLRHGDDYIGFDGFRAWLTPGAALSIEQRLSSSTSAEIWPEPVDSNRGGFEDTQLDNYEAFDHLKEAISDRLNIGYQYFGYQNYLTRAIQCNVTWAEDDDSWTHELTVPMAIPWDFERRVLPGILECIHLRVKDILIPLHDPSTLDPTTAVLPPMHDTKDERGNLRYWLVKPEHAFQGRCKIIDEIFTILRHLHEWWKGPEWVAEQLSTDLMEKIQYRTDVKECVYHLARRCVRRDDDVP